MASILLTLPIIPKESKSTAFHHDSRYILTQAPLVRPNKRTSTDESFWRMVWENDVPMIAALQPPKSDKAEKYWPGIGQKRDIEFRQGTLSIQMTDDGVTSHDGVFETRVFTLTYCTPSAKGAGETTVVERRSLEHLMFLKWEDQSAPAVQDMTIFIKHFRETLSLKRGSEHNRQGPVVVHCSAGVGRAGTFVVANQGIDEILYRQSLLSNSTGSEAAVSVPFKLSDLILKGRQQRNPMFVQTYPQHDFLFRFLANFILRELPGTDGPKSKQRCEKTRECRGNDPCPVFIAYPIHRYMF